MEDKDIIIAKQNAFIAYLKYEIKELEFEKGKLTSEIEYLKHERSLNNELSSKNTKVIHQANEIKQLKKEVQLANQNKNRANFNFNLYKMEFRKALRKYNLENYLNESMEVENKEKH